MKHACIGLLFLTGSLVPAWAQAQVQTPPVSRRPPVTSMQTPTAVVWITLDANRDGELSAEEIENATAALKRLDRNGDGKLERSELVPDREGAKREDAQLRGAQNMTDRIMRQDTNHDGKVTNDELTPGMRRLLQGADKNGDGVIDRAEAEAFSAAFVDRSRERRPPGSEGPAEKK